ncbi:MAG: polysaccharide deacetylase family protein, partial [Clostridia bacterium]|nr:polysaccharide deacetylase family protein [Clostridia bacterium]
PYVVSPETVQADIACLQSLGYSCILPSEAIAFCAGTGSLPEKPVLVTFDDGYLNNLTYVLPILEELEGKALINAVGSYADQYTETPDPNPNYAYLSWDQLEELAASGRVEIGNHSYNLHVTAPRKGILPLSGESAAQHKNLVTGDLCRMEGELKERNLSSGVFAYPFGAMNPDCAALVRALGFSMTLTCREGISTIKAGDPSSLLSLCRYNRSAGPTSSAFFDEILKGDE